MAFGLLEAIVVFYLQQLIGQNTQQLLHGKYSVLLNLKIIAFITPSHPLLKSMKVTSIEILREFSTIVMLLSLAYLAGNTVKQRIGAFLLSFAMWDIFYYVFLKLLIGWPKSLFDLDVFFLIPIPWVGPVITPLGISVIISIIGAKIYLSQGEKQRHK